MLWGLTITALLAFVLAFTAHSPGWVGLGIAVGLICGILAALVFIDRHVRASARPEHMTNREIEALRSTMRNPGAGNKQLPPSQSP